MLYISVMETVNFYHLLLVPFGMDVTESTVKIDDGLYML